MLALPKSIDSIGHYDVPVDTDVTLSPAALLRINSAKGLTSDDRFFATLRITFRASSKC
jgi:hypothetical protein